MQKLLTLDEIEKWQARYGTKDDNYLLAIIDEHKQAQEDYSIMSTNHRLKAAIAEFVIRNRKRG